MRLYCECCEKELDYIVIDGYYFADNIAQDIPFHFHKDGSVTSPINWEIDPYCKQLNKNYFMDLANKYSSSIDIGICPHCRDEVGVEKDA